MARDLPDVYTTLKSRRGKVTHAVSITVAPLRTVCGKRCDGWCVVAEPLDCDDCIKIVHMDCRPKAEKRSSK